MQKFILENLDCPSCAQKIENVLNAMPNVLSAKVDFNTNTLQINTNDIDAVKQKIREIESKVRLHTTYPTHISHTNKSEILMLLGLFAGFCVGIFFLYGLAFESYRNVLPFDSAHCAYMILGVVYVIAGFPVFKTMLTNFKHKIFFDEHFLMSFATFAAICIGEMSEAVAVMLFFRLGELLESIVVKRSKRSINALLEAIPEVAHLKFSSSNEADDIRDVSPNELALGDVILVKVGEKVPTDGKVIYGKSYLDTRAINGESVPVSVDVGDMILAGSINTSALLEVEVTSVFEDSHIAKIQELVQNASANKAKTQKVITSFARVYTPIVFVLSLCVGLIPPLFVGDWNEWIYRGLVVMMVSCPCALIISVPLGYFGAIGASSMKGILFKGSTYLETLSMVKNIVFDKTGTLTQGVFEVCEIVPQRGFEEKDLLQLAVCGEAMSNHPIATCIREATHSLNLHQCYVRDYQEISGKGIVAFCGEDKILLGNEMLLKDEGVVFESCQNQGGSVVYIAKNGVYAGYIVISDKIKEESKDMIAKLKAQGIEHFAILSGDTQANVDRIARELSISQAYGGLLPAQKAEKLQRLMKEYENSKTAFVGDGINDAVVLSLADVGISIAAQEKGNDVSKESADIILATPSLMALYHAVKIAQKTRYITWQNITFALGSKAVLIILGAMGIANMWLAVFGDVGVAILALLNAMRVIKSV